MVADAADSKKPAYTGLAATPPMGWNSWNTFGKNINEEVVRGVADKFVEIGLKDLGYQYIVIDDHWEAGRDADGHVLANKEKFPSGIKALADYIHSKGHRLQWLERRCSSGARAICTGWRMGSR
jgi:alpha-galactosidase